MKEISSLLLSIGEMDTSYIVIAFVVIVVLWIVSKIASNRK